MEHSLYFFFFGVVLAMYSITFARKAVEPPENRGQTTIPLPTPDTDRLLATAQGNPFYLAELVTLLLERGARIDIFCAAMMGQLDAVRSFLTLQPKLIDARGPHGFTLHFHAQVGGKASEEVLDYLQSVKKIELKPNPFLKKAAEPPK